MRFQNIFLLLVSLLFCISRSAKGQDFTAVDYIQQGFITHGVKELKKEAGSNNVSAQFYLGKCYEYGIGMEKNATEAFRYYRRAAERGLPDAMYSIAMFYSNGIVVQRNESRKQEWLSRFEKKGGKCLLPDIVSIYNEGLKHAENYALNPNGGNYAVAGNVYAQNNGIVNSGNTIASNNQTVNNITIVQQVAASPVATVAQQSAVPQEAKTESKADVDINIPTSAAENANTFAWIIANENYQNVAKVPNALNDGMVFAEYCEKTLGLPKSNIHLVKNATYNNIKRELNLIKQIAQAYKGEGRFIVYYAGHGLPDEASKDAYLLPVDGYNSDLTTCYSLGAFYKTLGALPSSQIVVLLDACFSGSLRGDGMLASARGVAIKAKASAPQGKMVVLSAAQGDETAYPFEEKKHGMFTYYLLKKLQESKGDATLGDLFSYVKDNVTKKSLVINAKSQTPSFSAATAVGSNWQNWTLK